MLITEDTVDYEDFLTEDGDVVLEDPVRLERYTVPADERLRAAARGDLGNTERTEHSDIRGNCCELQLYLSGRAFHPIEGKGLGPPDGVAIYQRPPDRSRRPRPSVGEAHRCNVCRESASETCGCAGGNARKRERSPANEIAP